MSDFFNESNESDTGSIPYIDQSSVDSEHPPPPAILQETEVAKTRSWPNKVPASLKCSTSCKNDISYTQPVVESQPSQPAENIGGKGGEEIIVYPLPKEKLE